MAARYLEAIFGTIWAALLSLIVLVSSIFVQFGVEFITDKLGVSQSTSTEYLVQVIDVTGAIGSGSTFLLLTLLQVVRLARDIKNEVLNNEQL